MLFKHAGTARFAYNWGLRWKLSVMEYNRLPHPRIKLPTAIDLHKELSRLKKTRFQWMYESSKCAPQEALRDLDAAFKNFFERSAGFPRFKSRKRGVGSFTLTGAIHVHPDGVQLPRIGRVRLKERGYIPSKIHVNSATISEKAGRWFFSVNVVEEVEESTPIIGPVVGVDRGISRLLVASDGTTMENPRALERQQRKLKHLQRGISRKKEGSKNRQKALEALRRKHYHVSCVRLDAISKATTMLAKTKSVIVVEDLNVKKMLANHRLARSTADASWSEVVRQLEYKTGFCPISGT
jgi:putative transposase